MKESIFIAWSCNQELALTVGKDLEKMGFTAIVGGGMPDNLYVGQYIIEQMTKCSQAIILSEPKVGKAPSMFSPNLLFEWGFLTAKLPANNIHVFLIDTPRSDLPSDLAGYWATTIRRKEKNPTEVTDMVVKTFLNEYYKVEKLNKLDIMHDWPKIKGIIDNFSIAPTCSENQLANYILHTFQTASFNNQLDNLEKSLSLIKTNSLALSRVIQILNSVINIYKNSNDLTKPLDINIYFQNSLILSSKTEVLEDDEDLTLWVEILALFYLSAMHLLMAKQKGRKAKKTNKGYAQRAITESEKVLNLLEQAKESNPAEKYYSIFYESYCHSDISSALYILGKKNEAYERLKLSLEKRQEIYVYYKQTRPYDDLMTEKLEQDYYLAIINSIKFEKNDSQKEIILKAVKGYLENHGLKEKNKQNSINQIKNEFFKSLTKRSFGLFRLPNLIDIIRLR